jgi:hypothetical protein
MKDYLAGVLVFCLLVYGCIKLMLVNYNKLDLIRADLDKSVQDTAMTINLHQSKSMVMDLQLAGNSQESFIKMYGKALVEMQEISNIAQIINRKAESFMIPIQEQKTSEKSLPGLIGSTYVPQMSAHEYSIGVVGSFRDSLKWLADIETSFPFSRVTQIEIVPSEKFVNMKVNTVFPKVDLAAINK